MPQAGTEADTNYRNAAVCCWCGSERDVAELSSNIDAHDPQEMCET
jgi:hypothetical protein